ncbi:hypothetical protein [Polymorphum gilvum]|uniref:hypothetical protein n=1 Tax=Polymorphum gilvum TaxID=991904 RepID=UPI0002FB352A|nr:hypothetical protein [Polymorphum gilvum]
MGDPWAKRITHVDRKTRPFTLDAHVVKKIEALLSRHNGVRLLVKDRRYKRRK